MNLIIDIGNSRAKIVAMEGDRILREWVIENVDNRLVDTIFEEYNIARAIVASTRGNELAIADMVEAHGAKTIIFKSATTPIPIGNDYHTPRLSVLTA